MLKAEQLQMLGLFSKVADTIIIHVNKCGRNCGLCQCHVLPLTVLAGMRQGSRRDVTASHGLVQVWEVLQISGCIALGLGISFYKASGRQT